LAFLFWCQTLNGVHIGHYIFLAVLLQGCAFPRVSIVLVETHANGTCKSVDVGFFQYWYLVVRLSWLGLEGAL
jgi:hypothetical protein